MLPQKEMRIPKLKSWEMKKREKEGPNVPFNIEHELDKVKIHVPLIELDKAMSIINQLRK